MKENNKSNFDIKTIDNSLNNDLSMLNLDRMFDMHAIIELLKNFNTDINYTEKVNYILRELRCRLTKKRQIKLKTMTINSIIFNDLLGIKNPYSNVLINLLSNEQ